MLSTLLRLGLIAATTGFYISAVFDYPEPLVAAIGLAPIAWITLEAVWHLFDTPRNREQGR